MQKIKRSGRSGGLGNYVVELGIGLSALCLAGFSVTVTDALRDATHFAFLEHHHSLVITALLGLIVLLLSHWRLLPPLVGPGAIVALLLLWLVFPIYPVLLYPVMGLAFLPPMWVLVAVPPLTLGVLSAAGMGLWLLRTRGQRWLGREAHRRAMHGVTLGVLLASLLLSYALYALVLD